MNINGVELENIDILDVNTAEKYESAIEMVQKEAEECKGLKTSAVIRKQCIAVFNCFNIIFGEDTDKKVFGDKVNLKTCLQAFEELISHVKDQIEDVEVMANKYSPNRAKRRTKK